MCQQCTIFFYLFIYLFCDEGAEDYLVKVLGNFFIYIRIV